MSKKSQQGVSVLIAILIMTILLSIGLGVSTILLRQTRMIKGMGDSVVAFYAADTGMERVLYGISIASSAPAYEGSIGEASYTATLCCGENYDDCPSPSLATSSDCAADYYCTKSVGIFKGIRRAIEVTR